MNSIYSREHIVNELREANGQHVDRYFDVLAMVKRKLPMISACGLLGILAGLSFHFNATEVYESTASLFVDDASLDVGSVRRSDSTNGFDSSIEKYIEVLQSDRIIGPAIDACDRSTLRSLDTLEPDDNVIEFIKENLYVRSSDKKSESGVISISLNSTQEDEAKKILVAILNVFDDFISSTTEKLGGKNLQTITQMQAQNAVEMEEKQREIDDLMLKPHIQSSEGKVLNQHQQHVVKIQEELHENESALVKLGALRQQIADAHSEGQPIEDIVVESLQEVDTNPLRDYSETQDELIRLRMVESELYGDYGGDHPKVKNVREQIRVLTNMRERQLLALFGSNTNDEASKIDFYSIAISHLDRKITMLKSHQLRLTSAMKIAKQKSIEIKKDCDRLTFLLGQREALSQRSMEMTDHSIQMSVLRDAKKREVELINYPTTAQKVFPKLKLCLPVGAVMGCGLGFCWGLYRETRDRTFRSSKEISDSLGIPVVAEIGYFDTRRLKSEKFQNIGGSVIALHRPLSIPGEAYKSLRTEILFDTPDCGTKVIQITSPLPGDGKSSVAANIAVTLSQAGRRVILVDCDLRRPALSELFSLDQSLPGLTSVLLDQAELRDAIQETGIENLDVLSSGKRYSNPADILTRNGLSDLLAALGDNYDFIILDTPPLLPVTDSSIISNFVDTIFLTLRVREGSQISAAQALRRLASVQNKIYGIIVNGITRQQSCGFSNAANTYATSTYYGQSLSRRYGSENAYGDTRGLESATIKKFDSASARQHQN